MNNLTTKEKAILLVSKYYNLESEGDKGGWMTLNDAKQCALIAVDEILNNFGSTVGDKTHYCNYMTIQYYQEVKTEIQKL